MKTGGPSIRPGSFSYFQSVLNAGTNVGRALQLKPDFAEAHLLAGNVLLKMGHGARAIVEYEEYLILAPNGEFASQTKKLLEQLKATGPTNP